MSMPQDRYPEHAEALTHRLRVGFILAQHFTLSAFALFVDQLRLAADDGDGSRPILCQWEVMTAQGRAVRSSCGVEIASTAMLQDPSQFDYIVVVGGLLHTGGGVDDDTLAYLRRADHAGVTLVGLCTGSFILSRAGLMDDHRCCISWYHYQDFLREFPHAPPPVCDSLFLESRQRITCAGGAGVADLATLLIQRHLGRSAAQKGRHVLLLDDRSEGRITQPHPPLEATAVDDFRVRQALLLMEQHLTEPLAISDLARRLHVSSRQFERLFLAATNERPGQFYRTLRLRYARWLLDHTDHTITDIALHAGFADCAHFSRQFKAVHGFTPSGARRRSEHQTRVETKTWPGASAANQSIHLRMFEAGVR